MRTWLLCLVFVLGCPAPPPEPSPEPEPLCGNGVVDAVGDRGRAEQCDDGNAEAGDGCSAVCEVEPGHGFEELPEDEGGIPDPIGSFHLPFTAHARLNEDLSPDVYNLLPVIMQFQETWDIEIIDPSGPCSLGVGASVFRSDGTVVPGVAGTGNVCVRFIDLIFFVAVDGSLEVFPGVSDGGKPYEVRFSK